MGDPKGVRDERRFNETLKRMLKTPPKPHSASATKDKPTKPIKQPARSAKKG
jgi:hypothetical protein